VSATHQNQNTNIIPTNTWIGEDFGIVPRSVSELFERLDALSAIDDTMDFSVYCQIMQVHM
jgi:hypothetical protein